MIEGRNSSNAEAGASHSNAAVSTKDQKRYVRLAKRACVLAAVTTLQDHPQGATEEALLRYLRQTHVKGQALQVSRKSLTSMLRKLRRGGVVEQRGRCWRLQARRKRNLKEQREQQATTDTCHTSARSQHDGTKHGVSNGEPGGQSQMCPVRTLTGAQEGQQAPTQTSRLHSEIEQFALRAASSSREQKLVQGVVARMEQAVQDLFGESASVQVFGSQAMQLHLPTSDLDLVVLGVVGPLARPAAGFTLAQRRQLIALLRKMSSALLARGVVRAANVISAKVPLLKCVDSASHLAVDLVIGAANGCSAVPFVRSHLQRFSALRPVCLVLKAFLAERGLNEVFTGGVGSYALVNLIIAHLQASTKNKENSGQNRKTPEGVNSARLLGQEDFGLILLGFFQRYGKDMDTCRYAISVARGGIVGLSDLEKEGARPPQPGKMFIEDPQEARMDIGKGSFRMPAVRQAFTQARASLLQCLKSEDPQLSPLSCIIKVEEVVSRRSVATASLAAIARLQVEAGLHLHNKHSNRKERQVNGAHDFTVAAFQEASYSSDNESEDE